MRNQLGSLSINLARAGAVLLALGALGYFVVTAQLDANPEPPVIDGPPIEDADFTAPEPELSDKPFFLPSSKSAIGIGDGSFKGRGGGKDLTDEPKLTPLTEAEQKKHFLYSSKSMPIESVKPKTEGERKP